VRDSHRHCPGIEEDLRANAPRVTARVSRGQLISQGTKGGAALLLAGSVAGSLVDSAAAADTLPDGDLAYARLLVGAELLGLDFYTRAIASKRISGDALGSLKRARLNEREHYDKMSEILSGAGQTPAVASDFDFSYPKGAFASKSSIAKLGVRLEAAFMGAYLGAVEGLQTNALKQPVAQIAANEAEHLSAFMRLSGRSPIGIALPRPLTIDEASSALDVFTS
jgi:Ferritin-like domain